MDRWLGAKGAVKVAVYCPHCDSIITEAAVLLHEDPRPAEIRWAHRKGVETRSEGAFGAPDAAIYLTCPKPGCQHEWQLDQEATQLAVLAAVEKNPRKRSRVALRHR